MSERKRRHRKPQKSPAGLAAFGVLVLLGMGLVAFALTWHPAPPGPEVSVTAAFSTACPPRRPLRLTYQNTGTSIIHYLGVKLTTTNPATGEVFWKNTPALEFRTYLTRNQQKTECLPPPEPTPLATPDWPVHVTHTFSFTQPQ